MNNAPVRTVSDAKRDFYSLHTRPINSIYRRVVDELLVEMHLLSVNGDFVYDPIYALGIVTTFDRFMEGYEPEADKASIFNALCRAIKGSPEQYRSDAEAMTAAVAGLSLNEFKAQFDNLNEAAHSGGLRGTLGAVASREKFKYSRPFGIGLYTLLEGVVEEETLKNKEAFEALLQDLTGKLNFPAEKLSKDLELYRSNLEKFAQAQEVMRDLLVAERKKREERQQAAEILPAGTTEPVTTPAGEPAESNDSDS
ncbi:MAG TPA: photosystem II biogenesis protein Psp29 [Leptolyngbyaceae cyanobacterium M65_K2018_010]|nr:photosystem II biogenesis protein Psp29 [Leptolyngbyaceae cyanobacterium M65_K2018_010]